MIIPKYVQELMSRASFVLGSGEAGYTIRINVNVKPRALDN